MSRHPLSGWWTVFGGMLLLAGCAVGPNYVDPVVATPAAYRSEVIASQAASDLKWWALFDDPLLYDLVTLALENNRDLKVALSRIEQARATVGFTRADQYPRLDVEAGAQTGNFSGGSRSPATTSTIYLAAPLSWEIDFWGKFSRSTAAARADLMASEFGLKAVQLTLVADVATAYYQLLDFHRRLSISESTLESRSRSLAIIEQRFDKGIIAQLDVNQAQIQKEIAAAAIPLYQRSIARTENGLAVLLGRLPETVRIAKNRVNQPPPEIPVGLPAELLTRRPDIVQARYGVQAQTERVGVAEALRLPSIGLTGSLGVAATDLASITTDGGVWSVGGRLLGPVIDFGKNKRRVEIEAQKLQQALYQFENSVLNAFREVEDALVGITTYRHELAALVRQQQAAANAKALALQRYDKGVSSFLEVLEAERALFNAELQLSELQQLYVNAHVNLYRALGGGWVHPD
jgi:multidrug efflux system outer membrane protein